MALSKQQKTKIVKAVYAVKDQGKRLFPVREPAKSTPSETRAPTKS